MSRNHFNRRKTEIKKTAYEAFSKCTKDYTRTRITALEREMNRELLSAANQATEGLDTIDTIIQKKNRTDDDANQSIAAAQPIKRVYQKNKAFMNMSDEQYHELTGPFTRARNHWRQYIRESPGPYPRTLSANLKHEVINLRRKIIHEVIQESRKFLQAARDDLKNRIPIQAMLDDLDSYQKANPDQGLNPIEAPDLQGHPQVTYNPPDSSMASRPLEGSDIGTKGPNLIKNLDIEDLDRRVKELPDDISEPEQAHKIDILLNNIIETYNKSIHTTEEIEGLNTLTQEFLLKVRNHIYSDEKLKELQELYANLPADISKLGQDQQVSLDDIIQTHKSIKDESSHMNEGSGEPNPGIQEFLLKVQNHIDSAKKMDELQKLYTTFTSEVERDLGPLQRSDQQVAAWKAAYDNLKRAMETESKEDNDTSKKPDHPKGLQVAYHLKSAYDALRSRVVESKEDNDTSKKPDHPKDLQVAYHLKSAYDALRSRVVELKEIYDKSKSDQKKLKEIYDKSKSERAVITSVNKFLIRETKSTLEKHKEGELVVPEQLLRDLQQILTENVK